MGEHPRLASANGAVRSAKAFEDLEGDRLVFLEEVHVLVDDAHESEVVVGLGDRQLVAELLGQPETLGVGRAGEREIVRPIGDASLGRQRPDPDDRVAAGERVGEQFAHPHRTFAELRAELPVAPDGGEDAQPDVGLVDRQRPAHGGAQVVQLMVELIEPGRRLGTRQMRPGGFGEIQERPCVATLAIGPFARTLEALACELVQQRVAIEPRLAVFRRLDLDEALVGERLQPVDDEQRERRVRVHDSLGDDRRPSRR